MNSVNLRATEFRHVPPQTAWFPEARLSRTPMRLLVIEDNRNLVANLFAYFEARGHVLDAAPDGITGLHLALTKSYDALILDWMLPRMDGPEVLRKLRDEGNSDITVVMLTARDELPDKIAGFRAGADDYLTKPFQLPELEVRLEARRTRPCVRARRATIALVPGGTEIAGDPDAGEPCCGDP